MVAAVAAIVALASGDFGETDDSIVMSSIGFAVFSFFAAPGLDLASRPQPGLRAVGAGSIALATLAYALFVYMVWNYEDDDAWEWFGYAVFPALAASHAALVVRARASTDSPVVRILVPLSVLLGVVNAGIGIAAVAGALDEIDEGTAGLLPIPFVLWVLVSVLQPVLRRAQGTGARAKAVEIKVRHNGPYKVTGPIRLIDADGNEFELPAGDSVVLCRCGASKTKPFCDKTHSQIGFEAAERAAREAG